MPLLSKTYSHRGSNVQSAMIGRCPMGVTLDTDRGSWGLPVKPAMTEGYPMGPGLTMGVTIGLTNGLSPAT